MFIIEWWNSLSIISQIFTCIAVPSTLVLLIQTATMLIGFGDDSDIPDDTEVEFDADVDDIPHDFEGLDGLRIFTVRGMVAFLVVFGWVGTVLDSSGAGILATVSVAALCGFLMMVVLAFLLRAVMKLRSDGNLDNRNTVGTAGKVYLTIPASRSGEGKVQVMLQGTYAEINAVTDEAEPIKTGTEVIVTGVSGQTSLVVKRK